MLSDKQPLQLRVAASKFQAKEMDNRLHFRPIVFWVSKDSDKPEREMKDSSGHVEDVSLGVRPDRVEPDVGRGHRRSLLRRKDEDLETKATIKSGSKLDKVPQTRKRWNIEK